jgi:hypothetical protein
VGYAGDGLGEGPCSGGTQRSAIPADEEYNLRRADHIIVERTKFER